MNTHHSMNVVAPADSGSQLDRTTARSARARWALLATAASAALLLSACSSGGTSDSAEDAPADSATVEEFSTTVDEAAQALLPEDIAAAGVLNIAVDIPYPPMAMYDDDGKEIGFDPELGRLIAQKLGLEVSLNKQAFDSVIPSLQAKKNDIIMSGMNDTPERQETLNFVNYTHGGFAILVASGNPDGVNTQTDLCGKIVAVQKATVQGDLLRAVDCAAVDAEPITVQELPNDLDAQTALRAGKSQAYVADAVVAEYVAANTADGEAFEVVRDPKNPAGFNPVYSGIGILNTDQALTDAVQAAFQAIIDEGNYQKILEQNELTAYAVDSAEVNQGTGE